MTYENHKKHIHVVCGQNAEYLIYRHVVPTDTTAL